MAPITLSKQQTGQHKLMLNKWWWHDHTQRIHFLLWADQIWNAWSLRMWSNLRGTKWDREGCRVVTEKGLLFHTLYLSAISDYHNLHQSGRQHQGWVSPPTPLQMGVRLREAVKAAYKHTCRKWMWVQVCSISKAFLLQTLLDRGKVSWKVKGESETFSQKSCPYSGSEDTKRYPLKKQWVPFRGRRVQWSWSLHHGGTWLRIKSQPHFFLTAGSWANHLISLCPTDLIYKMGVAAVIVTGYSVGKVSQCL